MKSTWRTVYFFVLLLAIVIIPTGGLLTKHSMIKRSLGISRYMNSDFDSISQTEEMRNNSNNSTPDDGHGEHGEERYKIAEINFERVSGPLIITSWLLLICVVKLGKYMYYSCTDDFWLAMFAHFLN